jgi:hypothetical protein
MLCNTNKLLTFLLCVLFGGECERLIRIVYDIFETKIGGEGKTEKDNQLKHASENIFYFIQQPLHVNIFSLKLELINRVSKKMD